MKRFISSFIICALILTSAKSQTVTLKQIGKENLLFNHTYAVWMGGNLYSLDDNRALYKTNLSTGEYTRLGTVTYKNTKLFFGISNRLYTIEMDGSMNLIDPVTGNWQVVTPMGSWTDITRAIPIGNIFYSIQNGAFYIHSAIAPKARRQIGGNDFTDPGALIRTDSTLHSMIDGTLYRINLTTGDWNKIGKNKTWKNSIGAAIIGNKLYTLEKPYALFESSLADASRKQLDATQFDKIRFLFADGSKLYCISREGSLYEIVIGN